MNFDVRIDDEVYELNIPDDLINQASDFFDKMDADMNQGCQMNREWVESPNTIQRCQMAADKLFSAIENEDHQMGRMMSAYICSRIPDIKNIEIDPTGDMANHLINTHNTGISGSTIEEPSTQAEEVPVEVDSVQQAATDQATTMVSKVFKTGRQYKFTTYNPQTEKWDESAAIGNEAQAEAMRKEEINKRATMIMEMYGEY